jgi:hypothetical protein
VLKPSCDCRTSKSRSQLSSTASPARMLSAVTGMLSTNSWTGTAPNLGFHSAKSWSHGIECTWDPAVSLLEPSTFDLERFAVLRMKLRIADYGLLSADLAAGIRRVKGVKKLGVRLGNW